MRPQERFAEQGSKGASCHTAAATHNGGTLGRSEKLRAGPHSLDQRKLLAKCLEAA